MSGSEFRKPGREELLSLCSQGSNAGFAGDYLDVDMIWSQCDWIAYQYVYTAQARRNTLATGLRYKPEPVSFTDGLIWQ